MSPTHLRPESSGRWVGAMWSPALTLIGFVLLLTPTGSLPSPRWRWPAKVIAATPAALVLVVTLAGGPVDPRYQAVGGPFDLRGRRLLSGGPAGGHRGGGAALPPL